MTLHDVIAKVLYENNGELTTKEIAKIINEKNLYERKDGNPILTPQISARIRMYSTLFEYVSEDKPVKLIENNEEIPAKMIKLQLRKIKSFISANLHIQSHETDLILYGMFAFLTADQLKHIKSFRQYTPETFLHAIRKIKNAADTPIQREAWRSFLNLIQQIPENHTPEFLSLCAYFNQKNKALLIKSLDQLFVISSQKSVQEFSTPDFIIDVLKQEAVFKIPVSNDQNTFKIYDPAAGTGKLVFDLIQAAATTTDFSTILKDHKKKKKKTLHFKVALGLQDHNPGTLCFAYFNSIIRGFKNIILQPGNSILTAPYKKGEVDRIITDLPLHTKLKHLDPNLHIDILKTKEWFQDDLLHCTAEATLIEHALYLLSPLGKAVFVLPEHLLFSPEFRAQRKRLTDQDIIEKIIALPSIKQYHHSLINVVIVIINKAKTKNAKGKIQFVKVSQAKNEKGFSTPFEKTIPVRKIVWNDYLLSPQRYISNVDQIFKKLESREYLTPLADVVSIAQFPVSAKGKNYPFVNIGHLNDKENTNPIDISELTPQKKSQPHNLVNKDVVLISIMGKDFRPTLFNYQDQPVHVSNDIIALNLNRKRINPRYLVSELNQPYIKEQIRFYSFGTTYPRISSDDLLQIKISVPSLEQQIEITNKRKSYFENILPNDTSNIEEGSSNYTNLQYNILAGVKHAFSQLYGALSSDVKNVKLFLDKKIINEELIKWEDKLSASQKSKRTLQEAFEDIRNSLDQMGNSFQTIQNIINLEKQTLKRERVHIPKFFAEEVKIYQSQYSDVSFLFSMNENFPDKLYYIEIDKNQFRELIRNFIINSIKHGFDIAPLGKIIVFSFDVDISKNQILIILENYGTPFPEDFSFKNFISYGDKGNSSDGSGIGGYIMNLVVQNHGGQFKILKSSLGRTKDEEEIIEYRENWGVRFLITLPHKIK